MLRNEVGEVEQALEQFFADGLITDVVEMVRKGKEATVFCCRGSSWTGRDFLAAKVYRPLEQRRFRNDAIYQGGKNRRLAGSDRRALANKSRQGRAVQYSVWLESEFDTLRLLHAAGSDVPEPIAHSGSALLMEFIGADGEAAPMLSRVSMDPAQAQACLRQIISNIALWLGQHRVHGDLSAYNILYRDGKATVIDFPQAVDPRFNANARTLLERDLENVCGHFSRSGPRPDASRIAHELWARYRHGEL